MSTGIFTISAANEYLMHTDYTNSVFFKSNGTYSGSSAIATTNFITNFALSTPTVPLTWTMTGYIYDVITTPGAPSLDGANYIAAAPYWIAESGTQNDSFQMYCEPAATHIHAFGATQNASGFGFACNGPNQSIVVSEEYKGFSIHKNSAGSKIRTGSCSGLAIWPEAPFAKQNFTQATGINVVFDKPYDAPPLIFIVESSAPIAMNFITRDGNGKYVGAEIVPAATVVNSGDVRGTAAYQNNSATFTYFIVSSEAPQYPDSNAYGMKVFNSANQCIFDSTAFIPTIRNLTIAKPYFSLDLDRYYRSHGSVTYGMTSSYYGVCINNFNAFTGSTAYSSYAINGVYGGPINFCGRYFSKNATGVTFQGAATNAFCRNYTWPGGQPSSWDFTRGGDQSMPFLYTNFTF